MVAKARGCGSLGASPGAFEVIELVRCSPKWKFIAVIKQIDQPEQLHTLVDFLIAGPGQDKDQDALKALIAVGRIIRAALWAIDHEARRVAAGCDRSRAAIVLADDRLPEDARRELAEHFADFYTDDVVRRWKKVHDSAMRPDQMRDLMRTLLEAIFQGSDDVRFGAFALAIEALDLGEVHPLLRPKKALSGKRGRGAPAQIIQHRLRALQGINYLHHRGDFPSATAARSEVAPLYGELPDTVRKWPASVKKSLGSKAFERAQLVAAQSGLMEQLAKNGGWKLTPGFAESGERMFGLSALRRDGEQYRRLLNGEG